MIELDPDQMLRAEREWQVALDHLHAIDARICLVVTGGGSGAIAKCFGRPGASRHLVEAVVPYSRRSAIDFLGRDLNLPSVCEAMASELAKTAGQRAERLADDGDGVPMGLALTAALPTEPPRDQKEAIYVASWMKGEIRTWCTVLSPGHFDRISGERIADAMIWEAITTAGS